MIIGGKEFKERTHIMGILNVTPDSFSDGGKFNSLDRALKHTEAMIKDGAELIDVGGESTRPGHIQITEAEEIERVVPVIERIKAEFDVPVSIDTYKSAVACEAVKAGADLLNDIWGFKYDRAMAELSAKHNLPVCIMHNRAEADYKDFIPDVLNDLRESIAIAKAAGVADENIMLDPGVGFGKTYEQNLEITNKTELLHTLGYPVLLATSRKSMIGNTLNLPTEERVEGTLATTVLAVLKDCLFVRVHDVKENKRVIDMTEKIIGKY
jgi:dihydropteroate synthase